MVRGRSPLALDVCGDSTPNLLKDPWSTLCAQIEKCIRHDRHSAQKKQVCELQIVVGILLQDSISILVVSEFSNYSNFWCFLVSITCNETACACAVACHFECCCLFDKS